MRHQAELRGSPGCSGHFSRRNDERGEQMDIAEKLVSHHGMVMDLTLNLGAYLALSVLALMVHLRLR